MAYSTASDLYLLFGKDNVNKWADANNNNDPADIAARIAWALDQAYDELNSKLSSSRYTFPLTGFVPSIVKRMEGYLAAIFLSEFRSITDTDEDKGDLKNIAKRVDTFIKGVRLGTIKLIGVTVAVETTEVPFNVNDFPQLDGETTDEEPNIWS